MPNPDKRYGVAVRLSDDAARNKPAKKGFFSHFATLPRKKKNQVQFWSGFVFLLSSKMPPKLILMS